MIRLELTEEQARDLADVLVELGGAIVDGDRAGYVVIDEPTRIALIEKVRAARHQHALEERARRGPTTGPVPAWSRP